MGVLAAVVPVIAAADAAPKSRPVDISAYKAELEVFTDAEGGTYLVKRTPDRQIFYGTGKTLYQQTIVGSSRDGDAWTVDTYVPRVTNSPRGSVQRQGDGSYRRYCSGEQDIALTVVTGAAAKQVIDRVKTVTTAVYYLPVWFARDTRGVYYYVDQLAPVYGGKGYRVFIGRKGAMKQIPVTDVVDDSAGTVFSTKSGDLHLVSTSNQLGEVTVHETSLFRGDRETKLVTLSTYDELPLIYSELGIYKFLGTICDHPVPVDPRSHLP